MADVKDLDPSLRLELRQKIADKYADFKFYGEAVAGNGQPWFDGYL